jgi:uncharacterized protein
MMAMIVDCHTHIDLDRDEPDVSGHLTAAEMVDACIVLAFPGAERERTNEQLAQYVGSHKTKMIGFGIVDPTEDTIDDSFLAVATEELGLKGFVCYCSVHGFNPTHSRAMRFYGAAQELGVPVFFHSGDLDISSKGILEYAQPYLLDEVARTCPNLKIIIGSMGLPFLEQALAVIARHESVYADLTIRPDNVWQTYNMVVAAHEQGVMDRLLFGSGYPAGVPKACIETLLGFNMLFADMHLPAVPRGSIRNVVERDTLELLSVEHELIKQQDRKAGGGQSG